MIISFLGIAQLDWTMLEIFSPKYYNFSGWRKILDDGNNDTHEHQRGRIKGGTENHK